MATVQAAGHTFIDGVCSCGRRREHLRGITRSHVGMNGIAHQGALNEKEADECIELDAKEARAVEVAMGWIKPTPIRTSDEMDSALRHGSPLRLNGDAGFYVNDGYYSASPRPMPANWPWGSVAWEEMVKVQERLEQQPDTLLQHLGPRIAPLEEDKVERPMHMGWLPG